MIIACPACQARFRLDETKIRGRGARVRCRRCGGPIIVMRPGAAPGPEKDLSGGAPPPPASVDLAAALRGGSTALPFSAGGPEAEPATGPRGEEAGAEPGRGADKDAAAGAGWEAGPQKSEQAFGERVQVEATPAGDEVDLAFEKLLAGGKAEVPGLPKETPPEEAPPAREPYEKAAQVSSVEHTGKEHEAGEKEAPPPWGEIEFAPEERITVAPDEAVSAPEEATGAPPFEIARDLHEQLEAAVPVPPPEPGPGEAFAGLPLSAPPPDWTPDEEEALKKGAPTPFDITDAVSQRPDETAPEEEAASSPRQWETAASPVEKTRVDELQEEMRAMAEAAAAPSSARREEVTPLSPGERIPAAPRRDEKAAAAPPSARPRVALLVLLFLVLAAAGAWLGFTRDGQEILRRLAVKSESWLPGKKKAQALQVSNLIGYYETGAAAGKLFVIKGQVANGGRVPRRPIRVVAALLDAKGQEMARKSVLAGNSLAGDFLRQSSREKIEAEMAGPVGRNLETPGIPPGKAIPFTVVFFDAPEGIDAYRLEAVESE